MKRIRVNFFNGLLAATICMVLLCPPDAVSETLLTYARPANTSMDPSVLNTAEAAQQVNCVYDSLTEYTLDGEIVPSLAESWEYSEDFKEWIFHLRKGVRFHDGTEFNAEAVKFSLDRILRLNRIAVGTYRKIGLPDGCEVIDEHTIKIRLKDSYPLFLNELSAPYNCAMISPTYVKKHATADDPDALEWMTEHACGTGPFKLVSVVAGQKLVFEKNEAYWGGGSPRGRPAAKLDRMIFQVVEDPSTARLMLEKGDVDMAEKLPSEQLEILKNTPGIKVESYPVPKIVYITFDVTKPPFDDINFRKAVIQAINYDELLEQVERGYATRMRGMIPSAFKSHDPEIGYDYDLEKAKASIAASKYPDGYDIDLMFSTERRSEFELAALYIQAYLKKIGVDVSIKKLAFSTQLAKMKEGGFGLSMMSWGPSSDPINQIAWLGDMDKGSVGGWNSSFYRNPEVEKRLRQAALIPNSPERHALYDTANRMLMADAVYAPICELSNSFAMRETITGFNYTINNRCYFWMAEKN